MTSTLEAISRQLGRMSAAGAFATHNTCGPKSLHLSVEGLGRVSLPVAAASARKLCAIAQPARHGYRDETRLDGRVRDGASRDARDPVGSSHLRSVHS